MDWITTFIPYIPGILGAGISVVVFTLLMLKKMNSDDFWYPVWIIVASILLVIGLIFNYSLGSLLMELYFLGIALWGLIMRVRKK